MDLKTFNIEVCYHAARSGCTQYPGLIVALGVGKALLEENSVKAVQLLFRERVEASTWREIFEDFFGPISSTEDIDTTSQCHLIPTVRKFDVVAVQPWAFENNMSWFTHEHKMEQVMRITRWTDTQLGSATYDSCTTTPCDQHPPDALVSWSER